MASNRGVQSVACGAFANKEHVPASILRWRVHEGRNAAYGDICFTHMKFPSFFPSTNFFTYLLQAFLYNRPVYVLSRRISCYTTCGLAILYSLQSTNSFLLLLQNIVQFTWYQYGSYYLLEYIVFYPPCLIYLHLVTLAWSALVLYHISYYM